MRTHTVWTKIASIAVCFGVLLSGPVMAGSNGIIKDVELTKDGTLYGQVFTPAGKVVGNAIVQLRYKGATVAAAKSNAKGQFAIGNVRGGAHELFIGNLANPVRLWANGTAPRNASRAMVVRGDETIIRGQDEYCETCPPPVATSGFGMLDVITLATVGAAATAVVYSVDNNNKIDDLEAALLPPASP